MILEFLRDCNHDTDYYVDFYNLFNQTGKD